MAHGAHANSSARLTRDGKLDLSNSDPYGHRVVGRRALEP